jgi:hypothetical protein
MEIPYGATSVFLDSPQARIDEAIHGGLFRQHVFGPYKQPYSREIPVGPHMETEIKLYTREHGDAYVAGFGSHSTLRSVTLMATFGSDLVEEESAKAIGRAANVAATYAEA